MIAPYIVGIRFREVGKVYHFDASDVRGLKIGDFVIVATTRGRQLGEVVQTLETPPPPPPEGVWKPVERQATPRDLLMRQMWLLRELEATINCRAKAAELKIAEVKIVSSEFSFDGERLVIFYSTEAKDKLDLTPLRKATQKIYSHSKVELRQVGPRDMAKMLGGMGVCGLETRCCSRFLTCFSPVSIKMAKIQGVSLEPTEITGVCGRLRCCLAYEYETYLDACKGMPKRGKRVTTPHGVGKVVDTNPLQGTVMVEVSEGNRHEFKLDEIRPWDEQEALLQKAKQPPEEIEFEEGIVVTFTEAQPRAKTPKPQIGKRHRSGRRGIKKPNDREARH
jgi:cell fate regulator YaaT (PSP1 superfamily)